MSGRGLVQRRIGAVAKYLIDFLSDGDPGELADRFSPQSWARFALWVIGGAYGSVLVIVLLTYLLNPFGNFPMTPLSQRFADSNQRYSYPSIIRTGDYDSAVFGTSTSRLLEPELLNSLLGGRFAALSMDAATAWEQTELTRLFLRHVPRPQNLLLSVDAGQWCDQNADHRRVTFRLFPHAFYDENSLNDFSDILNLEIWNALRKSIKMMLGLEKPYFNAAGYGDFTPGEAHYDAARARAHIYSEPVPASYQPPLDQAQLNALTFPALSWLDKTLEQIPPETRVVLMRMPIHVAAQPQPGSIEESAAAECFRRVANIGRRHGAYVLDMAFPSEITTNDQNYWDGVHVRLPVARRVAREISEAIKSGRSSSVLKLVVPAQD